MNNSLFRVFLKRTRGSRTSVSSTRRQHLAAASLPDGVEFGGTRGNLVGRRFRELLQGHVIIEAHQGFDSRRLHFSLRFVAECTRLMRAQHGCAMRGGSSSPIQ